MKAVVLAVATLFSTIALAQEPLQFRNVDIESGTHRSTGAVTVVTKDGHVNDIMLVGETKEGLKEVVVAKAPRGASPGDAWRARAVFSGHIDRITSVTEIHRVASGK